MSPQNIRMKWDGPRIRAAQREAAVRGLALGTEHILGVSREKVPHEEGTLERSGVASVDAERLEGAVSYDTPYAVRQHEDLSLHHDDGREAKYLERPFNTEAGTVRDLIAAELRRGLT